MIAVIVVIVVVVLLALWVMGMYNKLVGLRNRAASAWSGIDVQLKRRHDLIPNLVETVKGYAAHEKSTFEEVTQARAAAQSAQGPAAQGQAEGMLTAALGRLMAVAEAYPELKASENFQQLQSQLTDTEDQIAFARQAYNGVVTTYNTAVQSVPTNIIAGMFHFEEREFFELDQAEAAAVREAPKVQF